jgi:SpoVK/Ycf46/Vps4 family AAA+-type ATPase
MKKEIDAEGTGSRMERLKALFRVRELPNDQCDWWESTYLPQATRRCLVNTVILSPLTRRIRARISGRQSIIVFWGPPGSGKTRTAIALSNFYAQWAKQRDRRPTLLLHAKASNWFSGLLGGSQKTVEQAFDDLRTLVSLCRVALIIDELESIATNRASLSAGDPTDVHRFVNAVLTGIDSLPLDADLLFLATSNQQGMIDPAFLDRASHSIYLGYASRAAARFLLRDIADAYRDAGVEISDGVIEDAVRALYNGTEQCVQLTGRDLSDLIQTAMVQFSTLRPSCEHLVQVARDLQRRKNNGHA